MLRQFDGNAAVTLAVCHAVPCFVLPKQRTLLRCVGHVRIQEFSSISFTCQSLGILLHVRRGKGDMINAENHF